MGNVSFVEGHYTWDIYIKYPLNQPILLRSFENFLTVPFKKIYLDMVQCILPIYEYFMITEKKKNPLSFIHL